VDGVRKNAESTSRLLEHVGGELESHSIPKGQTQEGSMGIFLSGNCISDLSFRQCFDRSIS